MCSHGIWLGLNSGEKPPPSHAIGTVTQRYITRTENQHQVNDKYKMKSTYKMRDKASLC